MNWRTHELESTPTYREHVLLELDENSKRGVYVGEGFAHGFLALEPSIVAYLANVPFDQKYDRGIRWNDPQIGIERCVENPTLSKRDADFPFLEDAENNFV